MSGITNYENLANAIILQAVKDYRTALKCLSRNSRNRQAESDKNEVERFFRSPWFGTLTKLDPDALICSLQKEADA